MATRTKSTNGGAAGADSITGAGANAMKDSFERAAKGFDQLTGFSKDNFDAFMRSADAAARGLEAINSEALTFTRRSLDESMTAAKGAMSARTVQEFIELQSGYTRSAFDSWLGQATRIGDLVAGTTREALEPLSRRFDAFVDLVQERKAS